MICLLLFKSEMFDEATSKEIDVTRHFCDIETSAKSVKKDGGVLVGMKQAKYFAECKTSHKTLSDQDLADKRFFQETHDKT